MEVIIGFIMAFGAILISYTVGGGTITALMRLPSLILVFGGTIGATVMSFRKDQLKRIGKILGVVIKGHDCDLPKLIDYFKQISTKTRKEGLLSLESEISDPANKIDPFIKKGLQMVVDGIEPKAVRESLELQLDSIEDRHRDGASIFETAGGYAPTLGIIGTVTGLVQVLGSLKDASSLGPKVAEAFVATLYGISSANLIWLPIGSKLKEINKKEMKEKTLIVEAVCLIQEGVNPNVIGEKLKGFLDNDELVKFNSMESGGKKES